MILFDTSKILQQAQRPLIIIGQGLAREKISTLLEFSTQQQIPLAFSRLAQDYVPYSFSLNMGCVGIKGQPYSFDLLYGSDVILSLGCRLPTTMLPRPYNGMLFMVDQDINEIIRNRCVNYLIEDAGKILQELYALSEKPIDRTTWIQQCRAWKRQEKPWETLTGNQITIYKFITALDKLTDENDIICSDAGSSYYVTMQVLKFERGQRDLTSGAFAAMGISLPLAIGAAAAVPNKQIQCVVGDGSIELNVQELKTLSFMNYNVKVWVLQNNGYLSMRQWEDSHFEGRRIQTENQNLLNFEHVAKAFELPYTRLDKLEIMETTMANIMGKKGPELIEVVCDPNERIFDVVDP